LDITINLSDGNVITTCNCYTKVGARGCNMASASQIFSGNIDDVRLYDRALTALEIQVIYNKTKNKYQ